MSELNNYKDEDWMKIPSDYVIPEKREKRKASYVDFSTLDKSQMEAAEVAMEFVATDINLLKYKMLCITGFAGCGKTFLESKLIEWMIFAEKLVVAVTAPTNKAVDVARDMCEIEDPLLTFSTLHKLLGLKESYDMQGRLKFISDPHNPPSLDGIEVLFIDETSMLADSLFDYILPFLQQGLHVIFVGDPAQIPPVNHIDCKPFLKREQLKHNIKLLQLTETHRQAEGNPILEFATYIRENILIDQTKDFPTDVNQQGGIISINKTNKQIIYDICDTYFANQYFAEYADFYKVIAYRNVTTNAINDKVRKIIYGKETLPAIMVNEKLLANSPIKNESGYIIFSTNAEFEVVSYELEEKNVVAILGKDVVKQRVTSYRTTVVGTQPSNKKTFGKQYVLSILHEDSAKEFKQNLEVVKLKVLKMPGFERFDGWRTYYQMFNTFADVKYNYAVTAHKSQGSSYENCMMLDWDISTNHKRVEANRIRYVAATRSRKYLTIVK